MSIGVIGYGSIGRRHAENLKKLGQEVRVYDPGLPNPGIEMDAEFVADRDALAECRGLVIASPGGSHADDMTFGIAHCLPMLVEKPLATSLEAARQLALQAEQEGVPVAAMFNLRQRKMVQEAWLACQAHDLGQPVWAHFVCGSYLPDWRPEQDFREGYAADPVHGGVIFDNIHELDLAYHFLGDGVVVNAAAISGGFLGLKSEELATIDVKHENGCRSHIHLDYLSRPKCRRFTIGFEKGRLEVETSQASYSLYCATGEALSQGAESLDPNLEYVAVMNNFLGVIDGKVEPVCPVRESLISLSWATNARTICGLPVA
jgi:predicted dehydrogenase